MSLSVLLFLSLSFSFIESKSPRIRLPKEINKSYAFVPMGKLTLDSNEYTIMAFFISKYEVSNRQYNEFLNDLERNHETEKLIIAAIDSNLWHYPLAYCEPIVTHYHSHPAYNDYPVVNISYEGAQLYCEWLTNKINKGPEGDYTFYCRLPQRKEWIRAANGTNDRVSYSWGGGYLHDEKGNPRCNYKNLGDEYIHYNELNNKYEVMLESSSLSGIVFSSDYLITAPVESFSSNTLGLYNMNGNVAEMVQEKGIAVGGSWNSPGYDVRNESVIEFTSASPMVGFRPVISFVKN